MNVYTHVNAEEEQKETLKFDTYFDTCLRQFFFKKQKNTVKKRKKHRKNGAKICKNSLICCVNGCFRPHWSE